MKKLIGLSGSLRQHSFNSSLLRVAVELMPQGAEMTLGSIRDIPLYDGDLEDAQGVPPPAQALKDAIAAADGLLLVTPEYNNSIPGVFKNAIDWLSRPPADIPRVFGDKPVAIIGATPGGFGTSSVRKPGSQCCAHWGPDPGFVDVCWCLARQARSTRMGGS